VLNSTSTPRGMVIDAARRHVMVNDEIGMHVYDYNTGLHEFSNFSSTLGSDLTLRSDGAVIRSSTAGTATFRLSAYNSAGGWITNSATQPANALYSGVAAESLTTTASITNAGRYFRANSTTVLTDFSFPAGTYGDLNARGTEAVLCNVTTNTVFAFSLATPSSAVSTDVSTVVDSPRSVGFGHDNIRYIVGKNPLNAAQGTVARVGTYSNGQIVASSFLNFGTSQLMNPIAVGTVLAPEPGSLLALAAGLFIVSRSRKRA